MGHGNVGADIWMAPESLRDDLVRAVGSSGRVDATGERSHVRTPLTSPVKRLGASLTNNAQQSLLVLPSSDESGWYAIHQPAGGTQDGSCGGEGAASSVLIRQRVAPAPWCSGTA